MLDEDDDTQLLNENDDTQPKAPHRRRAGVVAKKKPAKKLKPKPTDVILKPKKRGADDGTPRK